MAITAITMLPNALDELGISKLFHFPALMLASVISPAPSLFYLFIFINFFKNLNYVYIYIYIYIYLFLLLLLSIKRENKKQLSHDHWSSEQCSCTIISTSTDCYVGIYCGVQPLGMLSCVCVSTVGNYNSWLQTSSSIV